MAFHWICPFLPSPWSLQIPVVMSPSALSCPSSSAFSCALLPLICLYLLQLLFCMMHLTCHGSWWCPLYVCRKSCTILRMRDWICHGMSRMYVWCVQEITHHVVVPELAFTGDTTVDFITDPVNEEVFRARLLIMECTFLDDEMSVEDAKVHKADVEGFMDCGLGLGIH